MRKVIPLIILLIIVIIPIFYLNATSRNAQWTVMVYLNGDNNLEEYGIGDFNEMEAIGSSSDINIIVQFDRSISYDQSNGDWTTCRRYYVTQDNNTSLISSELIEDIGEVDMGDPITLANFANWAKNNYPASNYLLIIWNHGEGWRKAGGSIEPIRAVSYDESSGNQISVANGELSQALSSIGHVDIIGFDACLMQMWEVMVNVSEYADCMVGSEETESAYGWNYTGFLNDLSINPMMDPISLGKSIINNSNQATLSVIDLTQIGNLTLCVDTFALELMRAKDEGYTDTIKTARNRTHNFYEWSYIDLYDFADHIRLSNVPEALKYTSLQVMNSIDNVVKETHNTCMNAYGVSISHPTSFTYYNSLYSNLEVAYLTKWDEYLRGCMYNDSVGIYNDIGNNWVGIDTINLDGSPYSFWGYDIDTSFHAAVRFTSSKPCSIKAIIAFFNHEFDYSLYIYNAGKYLMPDSILHSQTGTAHHCWNYIPLPIPIVLQSDDDFWVSIYTQNAYYPIGVDNGSWASHRSYCSFNGENWEEAFENSTFYNFNIRAEVQYSPYMSVKDQKIKKEINQKQECINMKIYPNPFNEIAEISFNISQICGQKENKLKIYDITGKLIRKYRVNNNIGLQKVFWDGKDYLGNCVPDGVYFCQIRTGNLKELKKIVIMR